MISDSSSVLTNNGLCLCWGWVGVREDCFMTWRDKTIFKFLSHDLSLSCVAVDGLRVRNEIALSVRRDANVKGCYVC